MYFIEFMPDTLSETPSFNIRRHNAFIADAAYLLIDGDILDCIASSQFADVAYISCISKKHVGV